MSTSSLSPQNQVIAKPILTLDPSIVAFMIDFKEIVISYGCMTIPEYLETRDKHTLTDECLLPFLQESGYGFVKTTAVNAELAQEVIVDLRYMAAAMLLIYSDPYFALSHSVLECLQTFYNNSNWRGSVCVTAVLLKDAYETYGHHFSYMAMADAADLSTEQVIGLNNPASIIKSQSKMIGRNLPALNELVKNDEELTAVFRLCVDVMNNVNSGQAGKMYRTYRGDGKTFNYFWRMACKLRDNARGRSIRQQIVKSVAAGRCTDPNCDHAGH